MKPINSLDIFINVVERGSFSLTARHFDMTPSAISRHISQLEEELGTRLFHRTTRKQSLTEAGEIYYQYAQRIHAEMNAAQLAVKQLSNQPKGILQITVEKDFAETFLQPLLPMFFKRYPDIQLRLLIDSNVVDLIAEGIDVAIRIGQLEDSTLVARKLMSSPSVICAAPEYFKQHSQPKKPDDLKAHNCLSFRTHSKQVLWHLHADKQWAEIPVSGNFRANSLSMLRNAALSGLGIIFIPQWFVQKELDSGALQDIHFKSLEAPVYAVFANNRQLAPKVRAFIDFIVEHLPSPNST